MGWLMEGTVMMNTHRKILLIEDDQCMRELIGHFFKSKGYEISSFGDAETAYESLTKNKSQCDIIVSDQCLPKMTGMELSQSLKKQGSSTPFIIVTGQKDNSIQTEADRSGVYGCMYKPLKLASLQNLVDKALESEQEKTLDFHTESTPFLETIVGKSSVFLQTINFAKRVANSNAHVLILGESGTGKEVIAQAIHQFSQRRNKPFIAVNCSAIPDSLMEAELFGYNKGAFTGAIERRIGLFEAAQGGTLFLDEIGDLNLNLQAKLLRVLQERKIKRIGENESRKIDCRVISATHKNLRQEVSQNRFREDLFYRLNVIPIKLPSLMERKEDIKPLADFFLRKYSTLNNLNVQGFSDEAYELLTNNPWPGNVRELENLIERSVVLCNSRIIGPDDLLFDNYESMAKNTTQPELFLESNKNQFVIPEANVIRIEELTARYIKFALKRNNGLKVKTAEQLGIDRKTLSRKLTESESFLFKTH